MKFLSSWSCLAVCLPLTFLFSSSITYADGCEEYLKEAQAVEGVVPKFNEDGTLRALLLHGEGTFISPKRSLINKARRKAELAAKRSFAEWMEQKLESETIASDMLSQKEVTDGQGNTDAIAIELEAQLNVIRSSTSAVLSGLVKLDECVDKNEKMILVTIGWKPSLSKAAGSAKQGIIESKNQTTSDNNVSKPTLKTNSPPVSSTASKSQIEKSTPTASGVKIITVTVEGSGNDLRQATNDALRSAVAQVFGEKFAAQSQTDDLLASVEVTDGSGKTTGLAVETSTSSDRMQSETKGLIDSYSYVEKNKLNGGMHVLLKVNLPKFQSSIDPNKMTVIILEPKVLPSIKAKTNEVEAVGSSLRDQISSFVNSSKKLSVLDRRFMNDQAKELKLLSSGSAPVKEMARLGNTAGADLMIITEILSLNVKIETRTVGGNVLERHVFDAEVSTTVIDTATTNIVASKRVSLRKQKFKPENASFDFGRRIGERIARTIVGKIGGGSNNKAYVAKPDKTVNEAKKKAEQKYKQLEKETEDDF